jgi:hypothetical protein
MMAGPFLCLYIHLSLALLDLLFRLDGLLSLAPLLLLMIDSPDLAAVALSPCQLFHQGLLSI